MLTPEEIIHIAHETLDIEAASIEGLKKYINADFVKTVESIYQSKGRVVITGVGKSAIIAQKIAATFNSTGTPSLFMHAADAIHGDLGMIQKGDVVICISKSGETAEIKALIPLLKKGDNLLVSMVGNSQSTLAIRADILLDTTVEKEACPNNLAPTSSTTAQIAMGDALAVCLLKCRNFRAEDFARFHPGGALGKRLYLTLADLLDDRKPSVSLSTGIKDIISAISLGRMGAVAVTENDVPLGIITDGDLRRMLESHDYISDLKAKDIMNAKPLTIETDQLATEALNIFREKKISQIIVTEHGKYAGMVHLHDLNREGII